MSRQRVKQFHAEFAIKQQELYDVTEKTSAAKEKLRSLQTKMWWWERWLGFGDRVRVRLRRQLVHFVDSNVILGLELTYKVSSLDRKIYKEIDEWLLDNDSDYIKRKSQWLAANSAAKTANEYYFAVRRAFTLVEAVMLKEAAGQTTESAGDSVKGVNISIARHRVISARNGYEEFVEATLRYYQSPRSLSKLVNSREIDLFIEAYMFEAVPSTSSYQRLPEVRDELAALLRHVEQVKGEIDRVAYDCAVALDEVVSRVREDWTK